MNYFFPFSEIRPVQEALMEAVAHAINEKESLVVHAPTGLGKTIASLGPALKLAEEKELTIFFLTSRHTQHDIAVHTLREIQKKYDINLPIVDILGKKWMCLQGGIDLLSSGEFADYCKKVREDKKCEYYTNARDAKGEPTKKALYALQGIEQRPPLSVKDIIEEGEAHTLCPYELALLMGQKAKVVIADYYYVFSSGVMENFFSKARKELNNSIIIVDEAHNLPERMRNLLSSSLSTYTLKQARAEANELGNDDAVGYLDTLQEILLELIGLEEEKPVQHFTFPDQEKIIELFDDLSEITRENKKRSWLGNIAGFLEGFSPQEGFVNIVRHVKGSRGERIELNRTCLDPSLLTGQIFREAYASVIMSGTLEPVQMYKDLLGARGQTKEFPSPFPKKNKLSLVVPKTTTKYSERTASTYKEIAEEVNAISACVPGNVAVFFPSYFVRDSVYPFLNEMSTKTIFTEVANMTKEEKDDLLERFKGYEKTGAVLLGVASGSFGEGIDLPGDLLKCVIVVGLPLGKPDLETQLLIDYYQKKFGKGWDYGYVLPALAKVRQNTGRCIRSETDKGAVIYLDKRYAWENYRKSLGDVIIVQDYVPLLKKFFEKN